MQSTVATAAGMAAGYVLDALFGDPRRRRLPTRIRLRPGKGGPGSGEHDTRPRQGKSGPGAGAPEAEAGAVPTALTVAAPVLLAAATAAVTVATRRQPAARAAVTTLGVWAAVRAREVSRDVAGRGPGDCAQGVVPAEAAISDRSHRARASVETLALRTCGQVVAPLFWTGVAGLPGLTAQHLIRSAHRRALRSGEPALVRVTGGAVSLVDAVPARLTGLLTVAAAPLAGGSTAEAWRIWRRDRHDHPVAGAGQSQRRSPVRCASASAVRATATPPKRPGPSSATGPGRRSSTCGAPRGWPGWSDSARSPSPPGSRRPRRADHRHRGSQNRTGRGGEGRTPATPLRRTSLVTPQMPPHPAASAEQTRGRDVRAARGEVLDGPARLGRTRLVAVDGPSGAGKSRLRRAARRRPRRRPRPAAARGAHRRPARRLGRPVHLLAPAGAVGARPAARRAAGRLPALRLAPGARSPRGPVPVPVAPVLILEGVSAARAAVRPGADASPCSSPPPHRCGVARALRPRRRGRSCPTCDRWHGEASGRTRRRRHRRRTPTWSSTERRLSRPSRPPRLSSGFPVAPARAWTRRGPSGTIRRGGPPTAHDAGQDGA